MHLAGVSCIFNAGTGFGLNLNMVLPLLMHAEDIFLKVLRIVNVSTRLKSSHLAKKLTLFYVNQITNKSSFTNKLLFLNFRAVKERSVICIATLPSSTQR